MRAQTIGLLTASSLAFYAAAARAERPRATETNVAYESALQYFRGLAPGGTGDALWAVRPPAVSAKVRMRALLTLPAEGELTPEPREIERLAELRAVLTFHGRLDAVTIKIIDLPRAAVGLHARSILLISRPAVRLLSAGELQGMVAHEIGHEFFWADFDHARARKDRLARQAIELKCDGIAVLTMRAIGGDPAFVESGVRALARFNEGLGPADFTNYPETGARAQFMRQVLALSLVR
jgi:hypothetical protein